MLITPDADAIAAWMTAHPDGGVRFNLVGEFCTDANGTNAAEVLEVLDELNAAGAHVVGVTYLTQMIEPAQPNTHGLPRHRRRP